MNKTKLAKYCAVAYLVLTSLLILILILAQIFCPWCRVVGKKHLFLWPLVLLIRSGVAFTFYLACQVIKNYSKQEKV